MNENVPDDIQYQRPVPRVPSRKDMQKQQKLVKRVSDLEGSWKQLAASFPKR
jgi:hypothetical protein